MDGARIHDCADLQHTVIELASDNIYVVDFPANSTHIFQPLDTHLFKVWKKEVNSRLTELRTASFGVLEIADVVAIGLRALDEVCPQTKQSH